MSLKIDKRNMIWKNMFYNTPILCSMQKYYWIIQQYIVVIIKTRIQQYMQKFCNLVLKLYGEREIMWTDRTKILLGQDGLNKLKNSSVGPV